MSYTWGEIVDTILYSAMLSIFFALLALGACFMVFAGLGWVLYRVFSIGEPIVFGQLDFGEAVGIGFFALLFLAIVYSAVYSVCKLICAIKRGLRRASRLEREDSPPAF